MNINNKILTSVAFSALCLGISCGSSVSGGGLSAAGSPCPTGQVANAGGVCVCTDGSVPDPMTGCPSKGPAGPALTFHTNSGPTLRVSTQAITPTALMDGLSFTGTTSNGVTTDTVNSGPTANGPYNGIFNLTHQQQTGSLGESVGLAHAVLASGPFTFASGATLSMTASSLASTVGLSSSDFGMWAIRNSPPIPSQPEPPVQIMTYTAFAGGTTLAGSNMPTTGTATYQGKFVGVLEDTPNGGSDDVSGNMTFVVDFAAFTITGLTVNGVTDVIVDKSTIVVSTTSLTTLLGMNFPTYNGNIPFDYIILTPGSSAINGYGFQANVTTTTVPGSTLQRMEGKFYDSVGGAHHGDEITGTFTITPKSLYTPAQGRTLIGSFGVKRL